MKIIIADDHELVRDGLRELLRRLEPENELIMAESLREVLDALQHQSDVDIAVLDLYMPGMTGVNGAIQIARQYPNTRVVIMSGLAAGVEVSQALKEGLSGFIPKTLSGGAFAAALRLIAAGEKYIPAEMVLEPSQRSVVLSDREQQILAQLRVGYTNKQIAQRLGLDEMSVKSSLRALGSKIGARKRTEIALKSLQMNL